MGSRFDSDDDNDVVLKVIKLSDESTNQNKNHVHQNVTPKYPNEIEKESQDIIAKNPSEENSSKFSPANNSKSHLGENTLQMGGNERKTGEISPSNLAITKTGAASSGKLATPLAQDASGSDRRDASDSALYVGESQFKQASLPSSQRSADADLCQKEILFSKNESQGHYTKEDSKKPFRGTNNNARITEEIAAKEICADHDASRNNADTLHESSIMKSNKVESELESSKENSKANGLSISPEDTSPNEGLPSNYLGRKEMQQNVSSLQVTSQHAPQVEANMTANTNKDSDLPAKSNGALHLRNKTQVSIDLEADGVKPVIDLSIKSETTKGSYNLAEKSRPIAKERTKTNDLANSRMSASKAQESTQETVIVSEKSISVAKETKPLAGFSSSTSINASSIVSSESKSETEISDASKETSHIPKDALTKNRNICEEAKMKSLEEKNVPLNINQENHSSQRENLSQKSIENVSKLEAKQISNSNKDGKHLDNVIKDSEKVERNISTSSKGVTIDPISGSNGSGSVQTLTNNEKNALDKPNNINNLSTMGNIITLDKNKVDNSIEPKDSSDVLEPKYVTGVQSGPHTLKAESKLQKDSSVVSENANSAELSSKPTNATIKPAQRSAKIMDQASSESRLNNISIDKREATNVMDQSCDDVSRKPIKEKALNEVELKNKINSEKSGMQVGNTKERKNTESSNADHSKQKESPIEKQEKDVSATRSSGTNDAKEQTKKTNKEKDANKSKEKTPTEPKTIPQIHNKLEKDMKKRTKTEKSLVQKAPPAKSLPNKQRVRSSSTEPPRTSKRTTDTKERMDRLSFKLSKGKSETNMTEIAQKKTEAKDELIRKTRERRLRQQSKSRERLRKQQRDMMSAVRQRLTEEGHDSGVDETTQSKDAGDRSPSKDGRMLPRKRQPRSTDPSPMKKPPFVTGQLEHKLPMNKIEVGKAASPNLKSVKSKVGSMNNTTYKPGGGKVKIESKKIDFSKTSSRIQAQNETYIPGGGDKKIESQKLAWSAQSKIGSLENKSHKAGGGDKKIQVQKVNFNVDSRVGSKDNIKHKAGGGDVVIATEKLEFKTKAESRVGSLDNVKHKPKGGDKKIFDDKDYLRQVQDTSGAPSPCKTPTSRASSGRASGTISPATTGTASPAPQEAELTDALRKSSIEEQKGTKQ